MRLARPVVSVGGEDDPVLAGRLDVERAVARSRPGGRGVGARGRARGHARHPLEVRRGMVELDDQGAVIRRAQTEPVQEGGDLGGVLPGVEVGVAGGIFQALFQQIRDRAVHPGVEDPPPAEHEVLGPDRHAVAPGAVGAEMERVDEPIGGNVVGLGRRRLDVREVGPGLEQRLESGPGDARVGGRCECRVEARRQRGDRHPQGLDRRGGGREDLRRLAGLACRQERQQEARAQQLAGTHASLR